MLGDHDVHVGFPAVTNGATVEEGVLIMGAAVQWGQGTGKNLCLLKSAVNLNLV